MIKLKLMRMMVFLALGAAAFSTGAWAQDPQQPQDQAPPERPKPAARGIPPLNDPNATVENTDDQNTKWKPDDSPVTGLQTPTLGSPELAHSYWVPGLEFGSTIQSSPFGQSANTSSGWFADNYVGADLSISKIWNRSQLGLNYSGGGYFPTDSSVESNGSYQQLSFVQNIILNRWQIQFFDNFSYLPQSQFGFAGGTGLALPGIGGSLGPVVPGLGVNVTPNQSIYSAFGPRDSNSFASQITYLLSRRGSITVGGSYGLLHFTQSGNVDNDMIMGSVGYNYALSKGDSIGIVYRFSGFHFSGEPQALGNHVANFVYSKKIVQRLALTLSGGPQITTFRVPIGNSSNTISASGGVTLTYAVPHGGVNLSYYHGLTGGSGVLLGSNSDVVTVTLTRQLTREWSGNVNFGYSRNDSLSGVTGILGGTYNDWFAGAGISRPFGRNINFSLAYTARYDGLNQSGCTGTGCNSSFTQNMISLSLQWHTRPFVLP
jgi:hypothetical protein